MKDMVRLLFQKHAAPVCHLELNAGTNLQSCSAEDKAWFMANRDPTKGYVMLRQSVLTTSTANFRTLLLKAHDP